MEDFFNDRSSSVGTKGLVYIGNDILVYKRDKKTHTYPGLIDLPGGGQLGKETPFETFKREVHEEFGLTLKATDIVFVIKHPSSINPKKFAYFPVSKLPKHMARNIRFGDEGEGYYLIQPQEYIVLEKVAWPKLQQLAKSYLES